MKLSELLDYFYLSMQGVKSPATLRWYQAKLASLLDFLGDKEVTDITTNDLRSFRSFLSSKS